MASILYDCISVLTVDEYISPFVAFVFYSGCLFKVFQGQIFRDSKRKVGAVLNRIGINKYMSGFMKTVLKN